MKNAAILVLVFSVLLSGILSRARGSENAESDSIRLVLYLTIDQARPDYMERFRPLFKGGLEYIMQRGTIFDNAHHHHAKTATAPGHASLATGLYPSHSGMIGNQWYDREKGEVINSVQDEDSPLLRPGRRARSSSSSSSSGRSPTNLLGTTLGDWIKEQDPESKVFSASRKDRSAILVGGHNADAAFWFDSRTGHFITSRYYMKEFPTWMNRFHERKIVDSYFGKVWEPLPIKPLTYEQLGIESLDRGDFEWSFPHPIGWAALSASSSFYSGFSETPFADRHLGELAKALIESESLGQDDHVDLLGLGFSAVDSVGHDYGPNSSEILDTLLRLDRTLGELIQLLEDRVGMNRVAIALSSDHGVMPLPEYRRKTDQVGRRFTTRDVICYQNGEAALDAKFGERDWLLRGLYLDYEAIGRRNLRRQEVEAELAQAIERCETVEKVWTRTQLESSPEEPDYFFQMYRNSFHPERSPDLFIQAKKFHLIRREYGTTHGSPYDYDSHVPFIIVFPRMAHAVVEEPVHTVDLAPTMAFLLNIQAPDRLDGVNRAHLIGRRQTTKESQ